MRNSWWKPTWARLSAFLLSIGISTAFVMASWHTSASRSARPELPRQGEPSERSCGLDPNFTHSIAKYRPIRREDVEFTLFVDTSTWSSGDARASSDVGTATLRIENRASEDLELWGMNDLRLTNRFSDRPGDHFYSASVLPRVTLQVSENSWRTGTGMRILKGGKCTLEFGINAVQWGRVISAGGPNQEFSRVVSPGRYALKFEFYSKDAVLESNVVTINVK